MKRVLYVLRYYPTLSETFVYREIRQLQSSGVHVEVLALGDREDGYLNNQLPKVVVHRCRRGVRGWLGRRILQLKRKRDRSEWARARLTTKSRHQLEDIARLLNNRGYTRLHAHFCGEAAEWARALSEMWGVPYSVTVHANDLFRPRISLPDLLERAQPAVCIASEHQEILRRCFQIEPVLIRSGVPNTFLQTHPRREGQGFHVVAIGRWVEKKGFDLLLEAMQRMNSEVRLTLVSNPPPTIAAADVAVGFRPPSEIPELLSTADVVVLPCRRANNGDRDGVPVVLLEAMASAVPVISTAISGISEVVDDSVGWLIPPDDLDALVNALRDAASDPLTRWRKGDSGRARVIQRSYTLEAQVSHLLTAWGWS